MYKMISEAGFRYAMNLPTKKLQLEEFESLEDCSFLDNSVIIENQTKRIHDLITERDDILKERNEIAEALEKFVFTMVKEEATTLSKAKSLLHMDSMKEAREWYESLSAAEGKEKINEKNK